MSINYTVDLSNRRKKAYHDSPWNSIFWAVGGFKRLNLRKNVSIKRPFEGMGGSKVRVGCRFFLKFWGVGFSNGH
jgi:hypothetical protein